MFMHIRTLWSMRSRQFLFFLLMMFLGWITYVNFWWHGGSRDSFENELSGMTYIGVTWLIIFVAEWTSGDLRQGVVSQFIIRSSNRISFVCDRFMSVILVASGASIVIFIMAAIFAKSGNTTDIKLLMGCLATGIVYSLIAMFFSFLFRISWLGALATFFVLIGLEPIVSKYISTRFGQFISPEYYLSGFQMGSPDVVSFLGCTTIVVLMFLGSLLTFRKVWI